jgi:hypothetical protein
MKNPFGRDPVLTLNLIAAVTYGVGMIINLSAEAQGWLNAIAVLALNLVAAGFVHAEEWVPIVAGLFKAVIALALSLGIHISADWQGAIMMILTAVLAFVARTQVVAPIDINGVRRITPLAGAA